MDTYYTRFTKDARNMANFWQVKKQRGYVVRNPLIIRWELTGSNRRPSACKADALNQLS